MFKHNLTACLNTQRRNKKGQYPLRIRSTIKRVVHYYPTGIMLKEDEWNGTEVVKLANRNLLNAEIRRLINDLEQTFLAQTHLGEDVKKVKKVYNPTFKEFGEKVIKDQTGVLSAGRIEQKEVYLKKFVEFNPTIKLKDVTKDTMIAFENFCRSRGNSDNTIHSNTSFLKSVLNEAKKAGIFQVSPGEGFKGARYVNPMRVVISDDELEKFENFADNPKNTKVLRNVASYFIFSCRTGLRYSDLAQFKGFVNGRITIQTVKTKEIVSFKATPKIIAAYNRLPGEIISNQKMNSYLHHICVLLNIDKKVTVHSGRHFFGTNFILKGGDIYTLMKLMAHSSVKTTSIYSKTSNRFLDSEMLRVLG